MEQHGRLLNRWRSAAGSDVPSKRKLALLIEFNENIVFCQILYQFCFYLSNNTIDSSNILKKKHDE